MKLLLDTTVLIDVLRNRRESRVLLARLVAEGHTLTTTAVNVAEVYAGMRSGEEARTEALLARLVCYALDVAIARRAGSLKSVYARMGQTLALDDTIVAATALKYGLKLMTDNRKDFPQPDLQF